MLCFCSNGAARFQWVQKKRKSFLQPQNKGNGKPYAFLTPTGMNASLRWALMGKCIHISNIRLLQIFSFVTLKCVETFFQSLQTFNLWLNILIMKTAWWVRAKMNNSTNFIYEVTNLVPLKNKPTQARDNINIIWGQTTISLDVSQIKPGLWACSDTFPSNGGGWRCRRGPMPFYNIDRGMRTVWQRQKCSESVEFQFILPYVPHKWIVTDCYVTNVIPPDTMPEMKLLFCRILMWLFIIMKSRNSVRRHAFNTYDPYNH